MTIALYEQPELNDQIRFAQTLADASLLPRAYQRQPANVLLAMQMGYALGLPAAEAITSIHVIDGKPSMSADLMAALIRRAGHKLRITEEATKDGPKVTATLIRKDDPDFAFTCVWDREKARAAGLLGKGTWKAYEAQMMRSRAITEVARQGASDVLHGVIYEPGELGDIGHDAPRTWQSETVTATQVPHPATSIAEAIALESAPEPVASTNSHPEPVVETQTPAKVSKAQLSTLAAEMKRLTLDKAEMLRVVADVIGKTVKSSAELSADEADAVIAALVMLDAPDADGVVDATLVDPWEKDEDDAKPVWYDK